MTDGQSLIAFRLVKLECGHEVMASAGAFVVRCATCNRLVHVAGRRV